MPSKKRVVVLISGSGSLFKVSVSSGIHPTLGTNLQALIDSQDTPALPNAELVLVISNRKNAYGLTRASSANTPIPTAYLALQPYLKKYPEKTREDYDVEIARMVVNAKPDIVVLAGWMHILSEKFIEIVEGRLSLSGLEPPTISIPVINLHPALPGAFDGANAIERAYEAFQKGEIEHTGCMVHRVVKDVDRGEPIVVREVKIEKGEVLEAFEERLHRVEHEIIVQATKIMLEGYVFFFRPGNTLEALALILSTETDCLCRSTSSLSFFLLPNMREKQRKPPTHSNCRSTRAS